jgi:hypothetical protein
LSDIAIFDSNNGGDRNAGVGHNTVRNILRDAASPRYPGLVRVSRGRHRFEEAVTAYLDAFPYRVSLQYATTQSNRQALSDCLDLKVTNEHCMAHAILLSRKWSFSGIKHKHRRSLSSTSYGGRR